MRKTLQITTPDTLNWNRGISIGEYISNIRYGDDTMLLRIKRGHFESADKN